MADVKEPEAVNIGEPNPAPPAGDEPSQVPQTQPAVLPEAEPAKADSKEEGKEDNETVPRSALVQERRKWQKRMRDMQRRSAQQPPSYQPDSNDDEGKQAYVRNLESQVAESQLKDKTRDLLKDYPELPKNVKRAILRNPLGFCKPGTLDVTTGVLDIQDYVEELLEEVADEEPKTTPKSVQVAGANTPVTSKPGATPAEVQKVFNKSIDNWTEADIKLVESYKASHT